MTAVHQTKNETRAFEADVSKLLHLMVHSVYSDRDVFLRELISNAADACERLRFEAIASPALLGNDSTFRITLAIDADKGLGLFGMDDLTLACGMCADCFDGLKLVSREHW